MTTTVCAGDGTGLAGALLVVDPLLALAVAVGVDAADDPELGDFWLAPELGVP